MHLYPWEVPRSVWGRTSVGPRRRARPEARLVATVPASSRRGPGGREPIRRRCSRCLWSCEAAVWPTRCRRVSAVATLRGVSASATWARWDISCRRNRVQSSVVLVVVWHSLLEPRFARSRPVKACQGVAHLIRASLGITVHRPVTPVVVPRHGGPVARVPAERSRVLSIGAGMSVLKASRQGPMFLRVATDSPGRLSSGCSFVAVVPTRRSILRERSTVVAILDQGAALSINGIHRVARHWPVGPRLAIWIRAARWSILAILGKEGSPLGVHGRFRGLAHDRTRRLALCFVVAILHATGP